MFFFSFFPPSPPLPDFYGVKDNVAVGAAVVLPLVRVQVRHPMLHELLLVPERPPADVALRLQRVLVIVVDPLVFHPTAVRRENSAALPPGTRRKKRN